MWKEGQMDLLWIQVLPSGDQGQPQSRQTPEGFPVFWVSWVSMRGWQLQRTGWPKPQTLAPCFRGVCLRLSV